jgi:hypothetical protein
VHAWLLHGAVQVARDNCNTHNSALCRLIALQVAGDNRNTHSSALRCSFSRYIALQVAGDATLELTLSQ